MVRCMVRGAPLRGLKAKGHFTYGAAVERSSMIAFCWASSSNDSSTLSTNLVAPGRGNVLLVCAVPIATGKGSSHSPHSSDETETGSAATADGGNLV